ncbi:MAG: hypothetical protein ABSA46_10965 [Thermodesulfovibrionales bacterium]|jgi:hypothetical protein
MSKASKCTKQEKESTWTDAKFTRISRTAVTLLGMLDRMIYTSKSMRQPTTIFNANIFNARANKIWFGDMEIERDKEALLKLARRVGPLYILAESDGRFLDFMPGLAYLKSRALVTVGDIFYSKEFAERVEIVTKRIAERRK